jgi:hypothetical protein
MESIQKENCLILKDEKDDPRGFAEFVESLLIKFENQNLIIDIQKYGELTLEQLLSFLKPSMKHYQKGKSFVILNDTINIDHVPEELRVVPTLQEAEDTIQMEEIERDLGF